MTHNKQVIILSLFLLASLASVPFLIRFDQSSESRKEVGGQGLAGLCYDWLEKSQAEIQAVVEQMTGEMEQNGVIDIEQGDCLRKDPQRFRWILEDVCRKDDAGSGELLSSALKAWLKTCPGKDSFKGGESI